MDPDRPERRRAGRDPPADSAARRRPADSRALRPATRLRAANRRSIVPDAQGHRGARRSAAVLPAHQRAAAVLRLPPAGARGPAAVLRPQRRASDCLRLVGRRRPNAARGDHQGLARVGPDHDLPSFARRGGAAIRAVPQAARLQRHRRHHRRGHDQHARGAGHRADLGLPLLLAARLRVRRRGAAPAESPRRGRGLRPVPARRGRSRPAAAALRHWRRARAGRGAPPPPAADSRAPARCASATPPTRRGRRPDGRDGALPRDAAHRSARRPRRRRASCRSSSSWSTRPSPIPRSPTRASGNTARCRGTTPSRRRCAGWRRTAAPSWPTAYGRPSGRRPGRRGPRDASERHPRARLQRASSASSRRRFDGAVPGCLEPAAADARPPRPEGSRASSSTVRAYEQRLVDRGLMLRYRHDDDFGKTTSAFTICSFWWVEALAMMGEIDEAITRFTDLLGLRQPARPLLRGRRAGHRPPARQLPAGVHARRAHPRRDHDRRAARCQDGALPRLDVSARWRAHCTRGRRRIRDQEIRDQGSDHRRSRC